MTASTVRRPSLVKAALSICACNFFGAYLAAQSPPVDLTLANMTLTSGTYQAANSITAGPNLIVSGSVNFAAGNFIRLADGFHATTGSTFHAYIACIYSISPASQSFGSTGGTGNVTVSAAAGCSWTAVSNNTAWLHITGGWSGNGNGALSYSVDANTGAGRTGILTVAGQIFTVTQTGGLTITTASPLPNGTVGAFYSQTLAASGGTPPYSWSVIAGTLPAGLSLSSSGVLSGAPTTPGAFNFTVQVTGGGTASKAFSVSIQANGVTIAGPSQLHVNLSFMPFSWYDYSHAAASYNFSASCPTGASVRSCFQTILANMRSQHVSGVRIFVTFCDGTSQALVNCGQPWQYVSWNPNVDPARTWLNNVNAFFTDVQQSQIPNVAVTFVHTGPVSYSLLRGSTDSPNHTSCTDTPDTVYFTTTQPFGLKQVINPDGSTRFDPIGYDEERFSTNHGYNCAPINPYFIGWNNQFSVVDALLGAAQGKVTISELEFEQELDIVNYTAHLRFIYDNAHPESAGVQSGLKVDILSRLRQLMSAHGFDPGRVTWSGQQSDATTATDNCTDIYTDYSRQFSLDAIASAIGGGYVGLNSDATPMNALWCGGSNAASMYPVPMYNTQPAIVDILHIRMLRERAQEIPRSSKWRRWTSAT